MRSRKSSPHLGSKNSSSFYHLSHAESVVIDILTQLQLLNIMVTFKGTSLQISGSIITLEGVKSLMWPKSEKVIYMIPGSMQHFHDSENKQILEIALLRCASTGSSRFSIKLITENRNIFLYSEFLKREIKNRIFVTHFHSPEGQSKTVFFCQTGPTLRENCLVNVAEDIFMKDKKIPQEDVIPKTIIQELRHMKSIINRFNGSLPPENTFLATQNSRIVDI